MKNKASIYAWTMLTSLIIVIAVTFVICLAAISEPVKFILFTVDIIAIIVFTICPMLITKSAE